MAAIITSTSTQFTLDHQHWWPHDHDGEKHGYPHSHHGDKHGRFDDCCHDDRWTGVGSGRHSHHSSRAGSHGDWHVGHHRGQGHSRDSEGHSLDRAGHSRGDYDTLSPFVDRRRPKSIFKSRSYHGDEGCLLEKAHVYASRRHDRTLDGWNVSPRGRRSQMDKGHSEGQGHSSRHDRFHGDKHGRSPHRHAKEVSELVR